MSNRRTFLAALAGCGCRQLFCADDTQPVIRPGWDWSLPEGIKPAPYSGFVTWGNKRFSEMITVRGVRVRWSDLNPAPGQYDWKPVLDAIEATRKMGMRVGLHVVGVERPSVPEWVIKKYGVPVLDVIPLQQNQPWRIQIVPPWHPDARREYVAFMEAFGKTGIPQLQDVVYGYIHCISPSRGEELFLRAVDIDDWEKKAGLTPELLAEAFKSRLAAMVKAFHGVEYKLAWMGGGPIAAGMKGYERYAQATDGLMESAIAQGIGWRGGGVDFQHGLFRSKALGASVTPEGYAVIDESQPIHDGRRYVGDENEEYGKYWEWRFGPYEKYDYRHRISTLKTLQLRMNFQFISEATLELNPDLNRYAMLTQGRRAHNSPDAWAYLRECAIRGDTGPLIVKNLERWLIQRDVEGHRGVACERLDRYPLSMDPPDRHYDFDARRTDIRNGQRGLAFQLDGKFWNRPAGALLKVTYVDREKTGWHVEYTGGGQQQRTAAVECAGDGERKSATLRIAQLDAARAFTGGMDFRIATGGPGDVTVTVVRVIRDGWKE